MIFCKSRNVLLLGTVLGLLTQPMFNLFGIYTGQEAIDYYGEVHLSRWNSVIHTFGMPFTYYGILLWFPQLFCMNKANTQRFQLFFYPYFVFYYMTLNFWMGLIIAFYYLPSQYYAMNHYYLSTNRLKIMAYGFAVSATALTIQEVFGHWLCGDDPSRLEAIPNAIWHAGYYSVWHLLS
jgi:hypothetical protein